MLVSNKVIKTMALRRVILFFDRVYSLCVIVHLVISVYYPENFKSGYRPLENKMKLTLIALTILATSSSYACMPTELVDGALYTIEEKFTELPKAGLQLTSLVRKEVNKVEDVSHCSNENMSISSFLTPSGKLFHAVYTSEDECDGGNSYGAVLDANLKPVAHIGDSDFYCID